MELDQGTELRRMLPEDLDEVLAIQADLGFQHWSRKAFLAELEDSSHSLTYVLKRGTIQGYMVLKVVADEAELCTIAVRSVLQRRGLASELFAAGKVELAGRHVSKVFLEVRRSNEAARSMYAKLGFGETGVRRRYYADGEDAVLMMLEVK